jgi:virulence-associated protein VapD
MNRYKSWTNKLSGLSKTIKKFGFKVSDSTYYVEQTIINDYCKIRKIKGSFTQKVIMVSSEYNSFVTFLKLKNK